jgi:hypothetical protein
MPVIPLLRRQEGRKLVRASEPKTITTTKKTSSKQKYTFEFPL